MEPPDIQRGDGDGKLPPPEAAPSLSPKQGKQKQKQAAAMKQKKEHEIISLSSKPFASLPLFIPNTVKYDPDTNELTPIELEEELPPEEVRGNLVICPNAGLEMLEQVASDSKKKNHPIAAISCVGPYRSGKSLLMSRFLNDSSAFPIGPTLEGCTRGIWVGTSALFDKETQAYKLLLDCEGMGDVLEGDEASNARIALASILVSSVFLFNATSHPDRSSLQFLRYLDTIRQRLPKNESMPRNFPAFVWVFRDFFLQLPKRKDDESRCYTLQEYMIEKVLKNEQQTLARRDEVEAAVIDSLLHDFKEFRVLPISYPKRKATDGTFAIQFSPEEMAKLNHIPWEQFDDTFRKDMEEVIAYSLQQASPLQLGDAKDKDSKFSPVRKLFSLLPKAHKDEGIYATARTYARWIEVVLGIVNSDSVIPNIQDMQHQLLMGLASEQLEIAMGTYKSELQDYVDVCPVFNAANATKDASSTIMKDVPQKFSSLIHLDCQKLVADNNFKGIAVEFSLQAKSEKIIERLREDLKLSISSVPILADSLRKLDSHCIDVEDKGSVLSQTLELNRQRSKAACEALARAIFEPVREYVREHPTQTDVEELSTTADALQELFRKIGRGPASQEVLDSEKQVLVLDKQFVARVNEENLMFQEAEEEKQKLSNDVSQLQSTLAEMQEKNRQEMEKLEQKRLEEIAKKEEELEKLKQDAQKRLENEIRARDERINQEKEAFEAELRQLKQSSDEKTKAEIEEVERKLKAEQEKIEQETQQKLKEAELKLQEEMKRRDNELADVQKAHDDIQRQLEEAAENQLCGVSCCCL